MNFIKGYSLNEPRLRASVFREYLLEANLTMNFFQTNRFFFSDREKLKHFFLYSLNHTTPGYVSCDFDILDHDCVHPRTKYSCYELLRQLPPRWGMIRFSQRRCSYYIAAVHQLRFTFMLNSSRYSLGYFVVDVRENGCLLSFFVLDRFSKKSQEFKLYLPDGWEEVKESRPMHDKSLFWCCCSDKLGELVQKMHQSTKLIKE